MCKKTVSEDSPEMKIRWMNIITDICILMVASGVLMALSICIQKSFSVKNEAQALVSTIQKGKVKAKGKDVVFTSVLAKGSKAKPDFINTPDFSGRTPLMWACYLHYNDPKNVKNNDASRMYYINSLLAQPGVNINAQDRDGWTALSWAAWSGMTQACVALIEAGADVNHPENNGYTPLMLAAMRGNASSVLALINRGADKTKVNKAGKTALSLLKQNMSSYEKNNTFFFSLTFSKERDLAYKKALVYLQ